MKPYGRLKHITGGNFWKIDRHPHPKHKLVNWWEKICDVVSRKTMKQKYKDEICTELSDIYKEKTNLPNE